MEQELADNVREHLAEIHSMCDKFESDGDMNVFLGNYMDKISQMQIQNVGALHGLLAISKSTDFAKTVIENYLAHFRNTIYERIEKAEPLVRAAKAAVEASDSPDNPA